MDKIDFELVINDGNSFSQLFKYLKNNSTAVLIFTPNSIRYNELKTESIDANKGEIYTNIWNFVEINVGNIGSYIYNFNTPEYTLCFEVKTFLSKITNTNKKDVIKIYKVSGENIIYISVIKPNSDGSISPVSLISPLVMKSQETYLDDNKKLENFLPNCSIVPSFLIENCKKIKPTLYKTVSLTCYNTHIEGKAFSPGGSDGELFILGKRPIEVPEDDIKNINVNINLNLLGNYFPKSLDTPIKIIKKTDPLIINLSSAVFKKLGDLSKLSNEKLNEKINFYFVDNEYIKIKTNISNYGIIRTYIKN